MRAKRLESIQGVHDVVEEIEAPLPVFIAIDPSYKASFNTVSQWLAYEKYQKEALQKAQNHKQFLKVFNAADIDADPKAVGIAGSPTIVYKVERIPKGKATRQAEVIDGTNLEEIRKVVAKLRQSLTTMVIK